MKQTEISFDISTLAPDMRSLIGSARFFDSSCSESAQTIYVDGDIKAFLKIGASGSLKREKEMQDYLSAYGLAAKTLAYINTGTHDSLLSTALDGEDAISELHLGDPLKLAQVLGIHLRELHSLPTQNCPFPNRSAELLAESKSNIATGYMDNAIVEEEFLFAAAKLQELSHLAKDDVVIHGDYCLPNILMQDFQLRGFVDLGTGGIGDRHYDLFWGMWSLNYNLGTHHFTDTFLDAYGRDYYDPQRLLLCKYLAAFTR